ncbi:hypothetical protein VPH35_090103 [Triticum aestivum]
MAKLSVLLPCLILFAVLVACKSSDCPTACGQVDVPYPFGINSLCTMGSEFRLDCVNSSGRMMLYADAYEVTRISLSLSKVWLSMPISYLCIDTASGIRTYQHAANLSGTPFSFSEDDNKFFVIGCNTVAYVIQDDSSVRGCISRCLPEERLNNGSCSGYGCCRMDIRRNMSSYKVFLKESYNSTEELRYRSRCSYVMVMEEAALDYSTTYIDSMKFYDTRKGQVPAVMDWAIGGYACKAARLNGTSYACVGRNTECVDTSVGQGYLCNCSSGYEGNPYTVEGCKDINECLDVEKYPCPGICKNRPGSYTCSCPPGEVLAYVPIGGGVTYCRAPTTRTKWSGVVVIIILANAIAFLLLVLGAIVLNKKLKARKARNLKEKNFKKNHGLLLQQLVDKDISEKMLFSLDKLEKATNNFDEIRKIGRGGHGTVYKGILLNQQVVVVKKSNLTVQSEIDGFINEVA